MVHKTSKNFRPLEITYRYLFINSAGISTQKCGASCLYISWSTLVMNLVLKKVHNVDKFGDEKRCTLFYEFHDGPAIHLNQLRCIIINLIDQTNKGVVKAVTFMRGGFLFFFLFELTPGKNVLR